MDQTDNCMFWAIAEAEGEVAEFEKVAEGSPDQIWIWRND